MKHSHMILIAMAVIVIGAAVLLAPKQAAKNSDNPPGHVPHDEAVSQEVLPLITKAEPLIIDGKAIDALCFVASGEAMDTKTFPTEHCNEDMLTNDDALPPAFADGSFIGTAYKGKADETVRGSIGYRYLGDIEGRKVLWIVENGGGSGVFTTLGLYDYDPADKKLKLSRMIAGGDRCNGGVSAAQIVEGYLLYERDVTPYDMVRLTGNPAREILQSEAAKGLPACAVCCYGQAQFEDNNFISIMFDGRLSRALEQKNNPNASEAEKCFDRMVGENLASGNGYFDAKEFSTFVGEIEHECFGAAEENDDQSPE